MIHDGATIALDQEAAADAQLISLIYAALYVAGYESSVANLYKVLLILAQEV